MSEGDREKLAVLLKHWAEHNIEHGREFRKWAEVAKQFGKDPHDSILAAASQMEKANEYLQKALEDLNKGKS